MTFDILFSIMQQGDNLMKLETKQQISKTVAAFRLPRYNEIPNVGLYLEQATKYVGECEWRAYRPIVRNSRRGKRRY